MAGDTERSPLLGQRSHSPSTNSRLGDAAHGLSREARGQNIIILMLCVILFFASWANGFTQIPLLRLVEDRICHEYYDMSMSPLEPIDENLCKGEWIQSRLAFILSISSAIGALAGFLAAFPWGAAADRIGRKPILTLALTGMALEVVWDIAVVWFHNMPIKLIWLGGVLNIVGGGNAIIIGMIFSIATDATTDEERAVAFLRLHVAGMAGSLVSPTLCALVMERASPWICQWIGVSLLIFGSVAIYAVPNPPKPPHSPSHDEQESDSDDEDPVNRKRISKLLKMMSLPITPSLFIFFLLTFLSIPVALATQMFMSQYVSKRYHIKLSSTGYIQSTFGVGHIIQAFIILPLVSRLLTSTTTPAIFRVKDEKLRDVVLLRGSFFFLIVGLIVVGLATDLIGFMFGLVVLVLGSGYASLLKSLMSLYADAKHRSRLFSLIGMVEVLARVYSEPALAGLYSLGLRHGGGWIGIPYFGVALFIAVCLALLSFVKLPKSDEAVTD